MSATATGDEPGGQFLETILNAIILYDDFALAANANARLTAAQRAAETLQWIVKPWRLDLLIQPLTADLALDDAAQAHLILLAVRNQADLPPWLLDWLEQWAERRQVQEAALAVWEGGNSQPPSIPAFRALGQLAGRHGLSLILNDGSAGPDEPAAFAQSLREREVSLTPTLLRLLDAPGDEYRHWGLNE